MKVIIAPYRSFLKKHCGTITFSQAFCKTDGICGRYRQLGSRIGPIWSLFSGWNMVFRVVVMMCRGQLDF